MRVLSDPVSFGVLAVATAILVATAGPLVAVGQEPGQVVHRIEIRQLEFVPRTLEAAPGDRIVWVNLDIVPHTASAQDGSWDSDHLAPGAEWAMTVPASISSSYFCRYHPTMAAALRVQ